MNEPRYDGDNRRKASLSDDDIGRIGEAFDKRLANMFEVIGYDTSTPEARGEIRKDHEFVRDARQARGRIVGALYTALGTGIASLLYLGAKATGKAP